MSLCINRYAIPVTRSGAARETRPARYVVCVCACASLVNHHPFTRSLPVARLRARYVAERKRYTSRARSRTASVSSSDASREKDRRSVVPQFRFLYSRRLASLSMNSSVRPFVREPLPRDAFYRGIADKVNAIGKLNIAEECSDGPET